MTNCTDNTTVIAATQHTNFNYIILLIYTFPAKPGLAGRPSDLQGKISTLLKYKVMGYQAIRLSG